MAKVYFSIKQANELIQKIRPDVEKLLLLDEQLRMLDNTRIEFDDEGMEHYLLQVELNKNFHEKNLEFYTLLGELIRKGCVIKDVEETEIDFFSELNGKEILFCWKVSEDKIAFWHNVGEDKTKRRLIKEIEHKYYEQLHRMK
jgi:hypothetical protein